ncbi:uncharacterized [Tachysurus ichikawai]
MPKMDKTLWCRLHSNRMEKNRKRGRLLPAMPCGQTLQMDAETEECQEGRKKSLLSLTPTRPCGYNEREIAAQDSERKERLEN